MVETKPKSQFNKKKKKKKEKTRERETEELRIKRSAWVINTRFERFDGNSRRVVPQSLPDFAELAVTKFAYKLQWRAVNLPLIASVVRHTRGHWFLDLVHIQFMKDEMF